MSALLPRYLEAVLRHQFRFSKHLVWVTKHQTAAAFLGPARALAISYCPRARPRGNAPHHDGGQTNASSLSCLSQYGHDCASALKPLLCMVAGTQVAY